MVDMTKTLPASWYSSKPLYELERRAVFLKSWYLLGPVTRFAQDEAVNYEFCGIEIQIERDGLDFSVTNRSNGQSLPHRLTPNGLVFAALLPDAPSFEEFFPGLQKLLDRVDFTKLPFKRTLSYEGRFNWKTMVDGYQECLHCQYTHRSFSALYPPGFYAVHNYGNYSQHIADPAKPDDGLFLYFFPNCTLNVYGGGMSSFRVCPSSTSPSVTRMEFDYYHEKDGEAFEQYFNFVRKVALEDYELCEKAQANLESGVYCQGILNPVKETGVIHYQQLVRNMVVEQFKNEREKPEKRAQD
ncbi:uncharacterized protein BCR38DRAFT_467086 [Pseudomassariella vexata]|uniref:Choline monooxygenase, chloroplastic n=1 Tax=Pseudomassariella vexata TaxID=1141098 RepID=A0A1Y2DT76_9PEZI|nr:uncharacterized protein BCR38DRAFT_467086 [Pseudomassariella vexata]ORY62457.1 hypothetical protein BCR38DRAFT_467086 [Pseudomassariella vexata]